MENGVVEQFGHVEPNRMDATGRLYGGWETPVDAHDARALRCFRLGVGPAASADRQWR